MVGSCWERAAARALSIEHCEPRCVLSSQAAVDAVAFANGAGDFTSQWRAALQQIHANYQLTGVGQTVVVIDSGIAYDHQALGGGLGPGHQVVGGWDFTAENDADPYDDGPAGFHGTHVAGIIASRDAEHVGLAPGVDLVALRVFDDYGGSEFTWIERALRWVHENRHQFASPITAVNLSIGTLPSTSLTSAQQILDDELAQLVEDGLFVAVAAGNGFDKNPSPGLSYPAASHWVVPVGSVDPQGALSSFSRRDPRMLLAPGENIESTITDYLFDFNGVTDDWYRFSGTSQATPFVTGAAVLVRQAMQRAGVTTINQQAIYDVLRRTAEFVTDPVSGANYPRIDVLSAVRSVLGDVPKPDLPSTPAPADPRLPPHAVLRDAGAAIDVVVPADVEQVQIEIGQQVRLSLDDVTYVLDRARLRTLDVTLGSHQQLVLVGGSDAESLYLRQGRADLDGATLDVHVSGAERVKFASAKGNGDQVRLYGSLAADTYRSHDGTHELIGPGRHFQVYQADRVYVFAGGGFDWAALYGSNADDLFVAHPTYARLSSQEQLAYVEGFAKVSVYAGAGGVDRAFFNGSSGDDLFVSNPHSARFQTAERLQYAESFDRVYATAGSGGVDRAYLNGSPTNDVFRGRPDDASLSGEQYLSVAAAFDRVYAYAAGGLNDVAYLAGSTLDDVLIARLADVSLGGSSYHLGTYGFDRVFAEASQAERDRAVIYADNSRDRLRLGTDWVSLLGAAFEWHTRDFAQVKVVAGLAGSDCVFLVSARDVATAQPKRPVSTGYRIETTGHDWAHLQS